MTPFSAAGSSGDRDLFPQARDLDCCVAFRAATMVIAYTAWDIQKASAGRFMLGLGVACSLQEIRSTPVRAPGAKDEDYFPGT